MEHSTSSLLLLLLSLHHLPSFPCVRLIVGYFLVFSFLVFGGIYHDYQHRLWNKVGAYACIH